MAAGALLFAIGVAVGGTLFSRSLPRSFLAVGQCDDRCWRPSDLAGLLASLAIPRTTALVPSVVRESDTCVAIRHPVPQARVHLVFFPKHDVKDIGTLTADDTRFVLGCFAMLGEEVAREHLRFYRVYTNGPERQDVTYLHFHLIAD